MIKSKSLQYCKKNHTPENDNFKASLSWVNKFCLRYFLAYLEATHQSEQKIRDSYYEYEVVKDYLLA